MDIDPEADSLSWAGETDASQATRPAATPAGQPTSGTPSGSGSLLLVVHGVFLGVYLLYTIGWFISVLRSTVTLPDLFAEIMYQLGEFLAIASPSLWFAAVLLCTRAGHGGRRVAWLLLGAAVLAPWPFILNR